MRKFVVNIETTWATCNAEEHFEVEDDATEEEIEACAKEIFMNYCSYGFKEVGKKKETSNENN